LVPSTVKLLHRKKERKINGDQEVEVNLSLSGKRDGKSHLGIILFSAVSEIWRSCMVICLLLPISMEEMHDPKDPVFLIALRIMRHAIFFFFFFGWCYSYGPQQGPDRQQKKRGERAQAEEKAKGSCSRRPRTKERKLGKRKKPK